MYSRSSVSFHAIRSEWLFPLTSNAIAQGLFERMRSAPSFKGLRFSQST